MHNDEATIGGLQSFSSPSLSLILFFFFFFFICFLLYHIWVWGLGFFKNGYMGFGLWKFGGFGCFQFWWLWLWGLSGCFQIWWLWLVFEVSCWLGFSGVGERKWWRGRERRERLVLIYNILLDNLYYCNELYWKIRNGMYYMCCKLVC